MTAVKMLLPEYANGDLAAVCSWADEIHHSFRWHWTSPLHYIDTPDFKCNYNYCRDCHDFARRKDRCVAGAIYNYSAQLSAYQYPHSEHQYNLTEALLFLSHFMGDIHQPLHVGFTGDEGGNTIIVHWYRRKTNLHHVWDDMIMESALKKSYNSDLKMLVQSLQTNILMNTSSHACQLSRRDWLKVESGWRQPSTASSFPTIPFISRALADDMLGWLLSTSHVHRKVGGMRLAAPIHATAQLRGYEGNSPSYQICKIAM